MLLIIFSNLTLTTKFKQLASRSGIKGVRIIQTPGELASRGCSYAVKAPLSGQTELFALMKNSELMPLSVYKTDSLTKGKISYIRLI